MLTPGCLVRCIAPVGDLVQEGLYLVVSATPVARNGKHSVTLDAIGGTKRVRWHFHFDASRFVVERDEHESVKLKIVT